MTHQVKSIHFDIPLPPSKNRRTTRTSTGHTIINSVVRRYRDEVGIRLLRYRGVLPVKTKLVVSCIWFKPNMRTDCVNFHDELCDSIAPALGLNDRYFLVRDIDYIIEKVKPKVSVYIKVANDYETKKFFNGGIIAL